MAARAALVLLLALRPGAAWRLAPRMSAEPRQVSVRFQRPEGDAEGSVVALAAEGAILMNVGDAAGVRIPRGCKTGICGTCTVDMLDPNFPDTMQTVRACCTVVQANELGREVLVDLARMGDGAEGASAADPMARFSDGWENEFTPDFRQGPNEQLFTSTGQGIRSAGPAAAAAAPAVPPSEDLRPSQDAFLQERRAAAATPLSLRDAQDSPDYTKPEYDLGPAMAAGEMPGPGPSDAAPAAFEPLPRSPPPPQNDVDPALRWRAAIDGSPLPRFDVPEPEAPVMEPLETTAAAAAGAGAEPLLRAAGVTPGAEMSRAAKPRPSLITFDATGTLMQLRSDVGMLYRDALLAHAGALRLPRPDVFAAAFYAAYKDQTARMPCFGCGAGLSSFEWWRGVMHTTFETVFASHGVSDQEIAEAGDAKTKEAVMDRAYDDLFHRVFAKGWPEGVWELRPGVEPILRILKSSANCDGVKIGVLSNFDDRLEGILESLGVRPYFDFILTSRWAGHEKPSSVMFDLARNSVGQVPSQPDVNGLDPAGISKAGATGISPRKCLHVGDTLAKDVRGAVDAGWQAGFLTDITAFIENSGSGDLDGLERGVDYFAMGDLWPVLELFDLDVSQRELASSEGVFENMHEDTEIQLLQWSPYGNGDADPSVEEPGLPEAGVNLEMDAELEAEAQAGTGLELGEVGGELMASEAAKDAAGDGMDAGIEADSEFSLEADNVAQEEAGNALTENRGDGAAADSSGDDRSAPKA